MNLGNPKSIFEALKGESDKDKFDKDNIGHLTEENKKDKTKDLKNGRIDSSPEIIENNSAPVSNNHSDNEDDENGDRSFSNTEHCISIDNNLYSNNDHVSTRSYNSNNSHASNFKPNLHSHKSKNFTNFIYGKQEDEEDNMNYTPAHTEHGTSKQNDILTGHNQDEEASYKNLTFHGMTSSLKKNLSKNKSESQTSMQSGGYRIRPSLNFKRKYKSSQNQLFGSAKLEKLPQDKEYNNVLSDADLFKSALHEDLINMMVSGPPAALLFYSYFTFDHKNNRRASLLLGALNVHVNKLGLDEHIEHTEEGEDPAKGFSIQQLQNKKFRIDLEYGMSETKMQWSVYKSYLEIAKLHSSLKVFTLNKNTPNVKNLIYILGKRGLKLPKFPRSDKKNRKDVKYFFVKTKNAAADASSKFNEKTKNKMIKIKRNVNSNNNINVRRRSCVGSSTANNTDSDGNKNIASNEKISDMKPVNETEEPLENEDDEDDNNDGDDVEGDHSPYTSGSDGDDDILSNVSSLATTVASRVFNPTEHGLKQLQGIMGSPTDQNRTNGNKSLDSNHVPLMPTTKDVNALNNTPTTQDNESENLNVRLEKYLKLLNVAVGLNPIANKIFHFYQLSPIGVLLSYEKGYAGKQGYLIMSSSAKANGWRVSHFRFNDWIAMVQRHTKKWFLVRHSYITFVSDIHSTTPLDVFLVDDKFKCIYSELEGGTASTLNNLQITLQNSEREMKLLCKSEKFLKEWVDSINEMASKTIWSKPNRFDSFAPIRQNCFAKLLVDGRDYFWALSEALLMAQDSIFIHDWWLSPELYMRRPVEGNEAFRIDRILKKKAEEGVKIFIIVYRNVGTTVGTDSSWTKHSLLSLHDNIHVIRSPNQWLQNTYFWAHHEKLAMVDNIIAFIGGIDLCYGRYDTPEHVLRDEATEIPKQNFPGKDYSNARHNDFFELEKPFESMHDRSTVPRMPWHDVHMMTVGEIARDLSRHFVQRWNYLLRQKRPSRPTPLLTPPSDLTEEEMNSLPYLDAIKDRSTCECQLLRSTGNWSLGLKETDNSIQKAYLKMIETSQHYMYIENQFFVTSSSWDGVQVMNCIGDAIVDRIIKAHRDKTNWKAFIIIPLMPAFPSEVDKSDGSSLRLIMLAQYMSISTGETSIYGKLKKVGIDAGDYIQFYSLRKWSEIGENNRLVTEQLYVHAKILIIDDRTCIIGSANVNERSMLGNRDSEVAIIVRDTEFVKSKMDGKEYLAGRFAFEMRQRLMREHLGCDVDLFEFNERKFIKFKNLARRYYKTLHTLQPNGESKLHKKDMIMSSYKELAARDVLGIDFTDEWKQIHKSSVKGNGLPDEDNDGSVRSELFEEPLTLDKKENTKKSNLPSAANIFVHTFNNRSGVFNVGIKDNKPISTDPRVKKDNTKMLNPDNYLPDSSSSGPSKFSKNVSIQLNNWLELNSSNYKRFKDDKREDVDSDELNDYSLGVLPSREDIINYLGSENSEINDMDKLDMLKRVSYLQFLSAKKKQIASNDSSETANINSDLLSVNTTDYIEKLVDENHKALDAELQQILAMVGIPEQLSAERKKKLFYYNKEDLSPEEYSERLKQKLFLNASFVDPYSFEDPLSDDFFQDLWFSIAIRNTLIFRLVFHCQPDSSVQTWSDYKEFKDLEASFNESQIELENILKADQNDKNESDILRSSKEEEEEEDNNSDFDKEKLLSHKIANLRLKLARGMIYGFDKKVYDKFTALQMLNRIHGHLVLFPLKWLGKEIELNNWFYNADRIPPIDIYD